MYLLNTSSILQCSEQSDKKSFSQSAANSSKSSGLSPLLILAIIPQENQTTFYKV